MLRKVIKIDEERCNGCGLCANACHEGAIAVINGKAKLMRDDYCDGLGNCLPVCPTGAISFEEREALPFNEKAVAARLNVNKGGCPGSMAKALNRQNIPEIIEEKNAPESRLMQWPIQIKLVPVNAPYFDGANLLVAADCTAFSYGNFHEKFIKNHITLIGCPKLDQGDYAEKLTEIIKNNNIKSIKVVRMEVPCCGGIENAVKQAIINSGKMIPWQVIVISIEGKIIEE
ncbi:MAG: 4Fe-4S binding protein [Bacillota bacterium]|nr:4Fe-4S binding protein [Bacillota bacterium]